MVELATDNLQNEIEKHKKVVVQYGAAWCGACRIVKPQFQRLGEEHEDIEFIYVDAEKMPFSRELANVENLPTFAGFVDGKLVKQSVGGKLEKIQEVINEVAGN
jgi:thiol-disulfide isomerase/thioredoxin